MVGDFSLFEEMGINSKDASSISIKKNAEELKDKYIKWYYKTILHSDVDIEKLRDNLEAETKINKENLRNYLLKGLKKANKRQCDVDKFLGTNGMARHYFGQSQWEFPTRENYQKLQNFIYLPKNYEELYGYQQLLKSLQGLEHLEALQNLERLQSLERLQNLQGLERLHCSYDEVETKPNSVIYCDIPYRNTDGYGIDFDYEKFYTWAKNQTEICFISEYAMPNAETLDNFTTSN